jgi:preprotein translocase subunit SecA
MVDKLGMEDDMPLEANILSKSIEGAQKKVEGRNFGIRKHVLQYDDVMNKQREIIYGERNRVLHGENIKDEIYSMVENIIDTAVGLYTSESEYAEEWDLNALEDYLHHIFLPKGLFKVENIETLDRESLKSKLMDLSDKLYKMKEEEVTPERLREIERVLLLRNVDEKWIDHIDAMDQLKQGIGLRAVGQEDPVRADQIEGFDMFNEMTYNIQMDTVRMLYHVTIKTEAKREQVAKITGTSGSDSEPKKLQPVKKENKVGRNDPCPCGSGKKYKKCCGRNA